MMPVVRVDPAPLSLAPDPVPTPRSDERRGALLAAAALRFNESGVRGATLAAIAADVGLGTSSVTYYYRRKEDLAAACFEQAIGVHEVLVQQAAQETTLAARVEVFLACLAECLARIDTARQPAFLQFNDIRALPQPQQQRVFDRYTDWWRRVRALLAGPETAHWTREDRNARTHLLVSVAHWMRVWIARHEPDDYPRVARRVAGILLEGLAAHGVAWPEAAGLGMQWQPAAMPAGQEAFLRAATELVNDQGFRGASVQAIAARLRLSKGSYYHYHDTKDDLVVACFERSFGLLRQALVAAEGAAGSGWQRTCDACAALVRLQLSADGPLLRSTATSALPTPEHRRQARRTQMRLTERLGNLLVEAMVDGSMRPHDPAVAAQVLAACVNATSELGRWASLSRADDAVQVYLRPALLGLRASAQRADSVASPPARGSVVATG